jgi:hypothetical protein
MKSPLLQWPRVQSGCSHQPGKLAEHKPIDKRRVPTLLVKIRIADDLRLDEQNNPAFRKHVNDMHVY